MQLVYAHPEDRADEYEAWAPKILNVAAQMDDALEGRNIRWVCTGTTPSILRVTTPPVGSDGAYGFSDYIAGVISAGGKSPLRIYLGFVSGVSKEYPYGGQATIKDDDSPTGNLNETGPAYSMVDHLAWGGALHELGHNLGAVQCSAPHSSCSGRPGHHHCWDENDIMCYDDGGDHPLETRCNVSPPVFDCGRDDYYDPLDSDPYLRSHWNTARSAFLTAG